jgi:hypothetical protein
MWESRSLDIFLIKASGQIRNEPGDMAKNTHGDIANQYIYIYMCLSFNSKLQVYFWFSWLAWVLVFLARLALGFPGSTGFWFSLARLALFLAPLALGFPGSPGFRFSWLAWLLVFLARLAFGFPGSPGFWFSWLAWLLVFLARLAFGFPGCGGGVTECLQLENTVSRNSGAHVVAVLVSGGNIRKISHSPDRADSAVETRTCNSNIRSTHSPQKCPRVAVYRSWRCYIKIGVRNKNLVFSGNLAVGVVSFLKYKGISRWDSEGVEFKIFRQSNPRGGGGGC